MKREYDYKFVRLGQGWLGVKSSALKDYQRVIEDHARDGWRLVQVFAPGTGAYGMSKYIEVILERRSVPTR